MARKKITQNGGSDGETENSSEAVENKKRDNFVRLASGRVSRAIDALSALQKLANTASYDWTQEDIDKIFNALSEKFNQANSAFLDASSGTVEKTPKQLSFTL